MIAPGPPRLALDSAAKRLGALIDREWGDYFQLGGEHVHSWRVKHHTPGDPDTIPGVEWCERTPLPLPPDLLTAAYLSPAARVYWSPLEREASPQWDKWVRRMNNLVERGRQDRACVVVADVHC